MIRENWVRIALRIEGALAPNKGSKYVKALCKHLAFHSNTKFEDVDRVFFAVKENEEIGEKTKIPPC